MPSYKIRLTFTAFVFLLVGSISARGQAAGSTEQSVVAHYGEPQIERIQSGRKIWIYSNGTRLTIANGVVVDSNVSATQPPPQRIEERPLPPPPPVTPVAPKPKTQSQSTPARPASAYSAATAHDRADTLQLNVLGILLVSVGLIVGLVASIWFIIVTFRESVLWGIACLLLPLASLIFTIVHWREAKIPFLLSLLVCMPLVFLGIFFGSAR